MTIPDRSGAAPDRESIAAQLNQSRKDLLDLTLRNSLLNFRPSRTRGLKIIDEIPREVFRILVRDRRAMSFRPTDTDVEAAPVPDDQEIPAALLSLMAADDEPDRPADRHTDNRLQTPYDRTQLDVRLRNTFRFAHTALEEQGVNILYLVLGMLHWYESDSSQDSRWAPLILVPAALSRTDARMRFTFAFADEEIDANLSLNEKLRQDFDIRLPPLPDAEDIDVDDYFRRVAGAVSSHDRWSVDADAIHLGFFSFNKLLIYKDLDTASWPENEAPSNHAIIQALFGGRASGNRTRRSPTTTISTTTSTSRPPTTSWTPTAPRRSPSSTSRTAATWSSRVPRVGSHDAHLATSLKIKHFLSRARC